MKKSILFLLVAMALTITTASAQNVKYHGEVFVTGSGAKVGALSIPTRYIHTGVEMLDLSDAEACVKLAIKFVEKT